MITEEMLREAAEKASEALTAYYERDYDPDKPLETPPEFEKKIDNLTNLVSKQLTESATLNQKVNALLKELEDKKTPDWEFNYYFCFR